MDIFGYTIIPTEEYYKLSDELITARINMEKCNSIKNLIMSTPKEYTLRLRLHNADKGYYEVLAIYDKLTALVIKRFNFVSSDNEDRDYARLCAEELLEKLRERI